MRDNDAAPEAHNTGDQDALFEMARTPVLLLASCDSCDGVFWICQAEADRVAEGWRLDCDSCTDVFRADEYGLE